MISRIAAGLLALASLGLAETLEEDVQHCLATSDAEATEKKIWKHKAVLGFGLQQGNSDTLNASFEWISNYEKGDWKGEFIFRFNYGEQNGDENVNDQLLAAMFERKLNEKASLFILIGGEHDEPALLTLRLVGTAGYKRILVKKENFTLDAELGAGVRYEDFRNQISSSTDPVAHLALGWIWKITKQLTYTQTFLYLPALASDFTYNFRSVSRLETPVGDKWKVELRIIFKYNSSATAPTQPDDLQVNLGLIAEF